MLRELTAIGAVDHVGGLVRTLLHTPRSRRRSIAAATLGALALVGSLLVAVPAQAITDTGTGGVFVPASGRALDTLNGTGGYTTPMPANTWRTVKITGLAGIPDDGSVGAVSLNATVNRTTDYGTLFARPDADTSRTMMMIYNGAQGEYVSNSAVVAVGADGTIQVQTETAARLILDVQGYYTTSTDGTAAGGFVPVAGKRIVDTRSGLGAPKALLAPGKSVDIQVAGSNGVPVGASGAVVNLLPINTTSSDGYLTPYATGATRPTNALHYAPSVNTSIQAQVPLSSDGKMTIYNGSSTANLVIDLQGYFTAAGTAGATFTPGVGRVFDSRASGSSILAKNEIRAIPVAGTAGIPVMGSGITAVVLTLTAAHGGSDGRASVWPNGTTQPDTTSINFGTDEIRTNTVTVALGTNGRINLNNIADPTNYVIDVQGWYTDPKQPKVSCEGYEAGSWNSAVPAAPVSCSVSAAPASSSDDQLIVDADGDDAVAYDRSDRTTSVAVSIANEPGAHVITATSSTPGSPDKQVRFEFGFGDWRSTALEASPTDDVAASTSPILAVGSADDGWLPGDASAKFSLYSSTDTTQVPLYSTGWGELSTQVPAGVLSDHTTYYWTASVQASADLAGTMAISRLPLNSFVTDASITENSQQIEDDGEMTVMIGGGHSTSTKRSVISKSLVSDHYRSSKRTLACTARGANCSKTVTMMVNTTVQTGLGITQGAVATSLNVTVGFTYSFANTCSSSNTHQYVYAYAAGNRYKYKIKKVVTTSYSTGGKSSSSTTSGWKYAFEPTGLECVGKNF
jgi:hypothetical protein